ncbi:MAG: hypothetical protein Q8P01_06115 [bacterium]|nr:hypothetical protein [bacterium]
MPISIETLKEKLVKEQKELETWKTDPSPGWIRVAHFPSGNEVIEMGERNGRINLLQELIESEIQPSIPSETIRQEP